MIGVYYVILLALRKLQYTCKWTTFYNRITSALFHLQERDCNVSQNTMQSLRSYVSKSPQATTGLRLATSATIRASTLADTNMQLCPLHHQSREGTAPSQDFSSRNASSISPAVHLASSSRALPRRRGFLCKPFQCIGPHKGPASYSTKAAVAQAPIIHNVSESRTGSWQYVVADPSTSTAAIIDPVLDYDPATGIVATRTADALLSLVKDKGYKVDMILETHAHADHITAASYLQRRLAEKQGHRPRIGIGRRIVQVQEMFSERYQVPAEEYLGVFDKLFDDDETFLIGNLTATAIHLPGHTPDHLGYKIGGETLRTSFLLTEPG